MKGPTGHRWGAFALGLALVGVVGPGLGAAAGVRDLNDGWLLGQGATAALVGRSEQVEAVAWWLSLGHCRLYELPDLPVVAARVGGCRGAWRGAPSFELAWQTLGQGNYQESDFRVHCRWGRQPSIGFLVREITVDTGGEAAVRPARKSRRWAALTVAGGWRPDEMTKVQLELFLEMVDHGDGGLREGRRRFCRLQMRRRGVGLAAAVDLKSDDVPAVGIEWYLAQGAAAFGVRIEPSVGTIGPVLVWRSGTLIVRTSHLTHPALGVTHRLQLGFGWRDGLPW